ncbi:MAG: hypothetical protein LBQ28_02430 [Prevotellaceae bacterium]|nr:hypothetical protein [Prevotellaceae bacterium]
MGLATVQLEYMLNAGVNIDAVFLRTWHPFCFQTNSGTITELSDIVNIQTKSAPFGCSKITIDVTTTACSGKVTFYDDIGARVTIGNWLHDFPVLPYSTPTAMTFKIETVTDALNRKIVWSGTPTITGGFHISGISAYGIPKYEGSSSGSGGGGSSGSTGGDYGGTGPGNHHSYYLTVENGHYVIVENASSDYNYDSVDWDNVNLISDPNVNTSALSRSVYINGSYDDDVRWREPYLALINN